MPAINSKTNLKNSFMAAFRGLIILIRNERNARIHFMTAVLVTTAGFVFRINSTQWAIILLLFAMIISAEMFNSAIEKLADLVEPNLNNEIRDLKDLAAGAVLWASMVSVIIGIIIFAPYILKIFKNIPNS